MNLSSLGQHLHILSIFLNWDEIALRFYQLSTTVAKEFDNVSISSMPSKLVCVCCRAPGPVERCTASGRESRPLRGIPMSLWWSEDGCTNRSGCTDWQHSHPNIQYKSRPLWFNFFTVFMVSLTTLTGLLYFRIKSLNNNCLHRKHFLLTGEGSWLEEEMKAGVGLVELTLGYKTLVLGK